MVNIDREGEFAAVLMALRGAITGLAISAASLVLTSSFDETNGGNNILCESTHTPTVISSSFVKVKVSSLNRVE
jgi:hypothetical protein